jgi:cyclic-di-AMP phosphodiesterase PgpH
MLGSFACAHVPRNPSECFKLALRDADTARNKPELDARRIWRLAFMAVVLAVGLVFILTVHLLPSRYEFREGDVSSQNIRAPEQVRYVSAIETRVERERAASAVQDVFTFDPSIAPQQRTRLSNAIQRITTGRSDPGMPPDSMRSAVQQALEVELSAEQVSLLLNMSEERWQVFSNTLPRVLFEVLSERVTAERLRDLKAELPVRLSSIGWEAERALAVDLIHKMARPNYSPNPAETARLKKEAQDAVAPITKSLERGEIILREGDVVRATDLERLEALGLRNPAVDWQAIVSSSLLVLLVLSLLIGYVVTFEPELLLHERRLLLIVVVMLATVLAAKLVLPGRPYWSYIFPIAAVAMLLATLLEARLALLIAVLLGFMVAVVSSNSLEVALIGLVGAVLGTIGVRHSERLHSYFVAGGMVAVGTFAVILAFRLIAKEDNWATFALMAGLSVVNGLLAASLAVGTFSLLGRLFGITTNIQLLELSDPTQPLLRRLLNEAPGTYHHSIMVGNLAERAAERIGADPLLVRVGSYYHDIGKLARPYFFAENQFDGNNIHDSLDPRTSARIVSSHVRDGLELAERHKLPPRIREFISQHHGKRLVSFFYNQAARDGGGEVDASEYSYPGPRPASKEAGIVMLADSVEAVVRSVRDRSSESIGALVHKVVSERMAEGELHDSDLTIRDLEEIKAAFTTILMGMYHPRIEYPTSSAPDAPAEAAEPVAMVDIGDGGAGAPESVERLPSSAT